jgi:hypothetical protein
MRRLIHWIVSLPERVLRARATRRALQARGLCLGCGVRPATPGCHDCAYCWRAKH